MLRLLIFSACCAKTWSQQPQAPADAENSLHEVGRRRPASWLSLCQNGPRRPLLWSTNWSITIMIDEKFCFYQYWWWATYLRSVGIEKPKKEVLPSLGRFRYVSTKIYHLIQDTTKDYLLMVYHQLWEVCLLVSKKVC